MLEIIGVIGSILAFMGVVIIILTITSVVGGLLLLPFIAIAEWVKAFVAKRRGLSRPSARQG